MDLIEIYADDDDPPSYEKRPSIFIEGRYVEWQNFALAHLLSRGFYGIVYLPRMRGGRWADDEPEYYDRLLERMEHADMIAYWMPNYPEIASVHSIIGVHLAYARPGKAVIGFPDVEKYAAFFAKYPTPANIPIVATMSETLTRAVQLLRH